MVRCDGRNGGDVLIDAGWSTSRPRRLVSCCHFLGRVVRVPCCGRHAHARRGTRRSVRAACDKPRRDSNARATSAAPSVPGARTEARQSRMCEGARWCSRRCPKRLREDVQKDPLWRLLAHVLLIIGGVVGSRAHYRFVTGHIERLRFLGHLLLTARGVVGSRAHYRFVTGPPLLPPLWHAFGGLYCTTDRPTPFT